jgi:NADH-quinone oxidoreductase subunit D
MEAKSYEKVAVMTDRLDYLNNLGNNLVYCMAIEKLADLDVPLRAQAIRVILTELQRISSHLVWLGTHTLDLAAISVFWYTFRERELILDINEMVSGQRMMTTPVEFENAVRDFIKIFPQRIKEYEAMLSENPIFIERTKDIGILKAEDAIHWGVTGPSLRATGVEHDLRKVDPYSGYEQYEFDVPTQTDGDTYARYLVRMEEMRQSLRIVQQALDKLPYGPVRSNNRKFVPPPRSELGTSMEAVIHHFKLWTDGFDMPEGSVYEATESPRGVLGVYLESDGGPKPFRVHWRTPSFDNLQILPKLAKGHLVADLVALMGTTDFVLGDIDR